MNYAKFFFYGIVLTISSFSVALAGSNMEKVWDRDEFEQSKIYYIAKHPVATIPLWKLINGLDDSDKYILTLDTILTLHLIEYAKSTFNTKQELVPAKKQKLLQEISPKTSHYSAHTTYNQLKNAIKQHQFGKGKKARIQGKR